MSSTFPELNNLVPDRLLFNIVILHEASSHEDMIPEVPSHLAAALRASGVSMVLVGLTPQKTELGRVTHSSGALGMADDEGDLDWVARLLRDWQGGSGPLTQMQPDGGVKLLFELDSEHMVAFRVVAPAAVHTMTDSGREWMLRLIRLVARNLRARIIRPCPRTRGVPPLNELSDSEWRILLALDGDDSMKAIAHKLGLSAHTVHSHVKSVYRSLRVGSRQSALMILHRAERLALLDELRPPESVRDPLQWNSQTGPDASLDARPSSIGSVPNVVRQYGRFTPRRFSSKRGSMIEGQ